MSVLDTNWQKVTTFATVNDLPLTRLKLTTTLNDDAGRGGADETLACNAVASVTDYQGTVTATLANEIRCVGARRVDNANSTDYGAGALGVQYYNTDGSGNVLGVDPFGADYIEVIENFAIQSGDLGTSWDNTTAAGGVTLVTDAATAPGGAITADSIKQVDAISDGIITADFTLAASTTYTVSAYFKNIDATSSTLIVFDDNTSTDLASLEFDWTAGVPSTNASVSATNITYTLINSLWYRISYEFTTAATVTVHNAYTNPEGTATSTTGVYAWGFQCNIGSLKQYVPTTTAAVTVYPLAGQLIEEASTNLFVSPTSVATQNITTTAQDYTVSVEGTGDITLTGTATGTATEGNPLTVTATAGTLTCTLTGSLSIAQVEAKSYPTSFMLDATTRPLTNAQVTLPAVTKTDFKVSFDFGGMVDSAITGVDRWLFCISDDDDNHVACHIDAAAKTLSLIKRVAATSYTSTSAALDLSVIHSVICEISSTNGVTITVDDVAATADANTTAPVLATDTVFIGQYHDQTEQCNGTIKNFIITDDTSAAPYTTRLTLTGIGTGAAGAKVSVTGVGDSTAYEGLQFTTINVDDDNIDIDWSEFGLTAPSTWTVGGMARLYQAPESCDGAMRVSFNPHEITAITSTGSTDAELIKENVLNSNRVLVHELAGGSTHNIVPTVATDSLITSVALVDFRAEKADGTADLDTQIRIRGGGEVYDVDVVYPAIDARYSLLGRPAIGYPGVTSAGYNENDPLEHSIFYVPPIVADGTEEVNILDANSGTTVQFSELLLCWYWTPETAKNFNFGSQTTGRIISTDIRRGLALHRKRDGLDLSRSVTISMMSEADNTYTDLLMKSDRTVIFDSYPNEVEQRWRTLVVGFLAGNISTQQLPQGNTVELNIIDTKLKVSI